MPIAVGESGAWIGGEAFGMETGWVGIASREGVTPISGCNVRDV
jgi:hypothetical protein